MCTHAFTQYITKGVRNIPRDILYIYCSTSRSPCPRVERVLAILAPLPSRHHATTAVETEGGEYTSPRRRCARPGISADIARRAHARVVPRSRVDACVPWRILIKRSINEIKKKRQKKRGENREIGADPRISATVQFWSSIGWYLFLGRARKMTRFERRDSLVP